MSEFSPQSDDYSWIHDLAQGELHPEDPRYLAGHYKFDPKALIEESSVAFLQELRELFSLHAKVFNGYSENGQQFNEVKIYGISQSPADFMVFRNHLKLVFTNSSHGVISASLLQHQNQQISVNGLPNESQKTISGARDQQDLLAELGPFLDVRWTFQGETVKPEKIVKYYFIEFIRLSRVLPNSLSQNQILLQQIKALLQDKGLEL